LAFAPAGTTGSSRKKYVLAVNAELMVRASVWVRELRMETFSTLKILEKRLSLSKKTARL